jgi:hypothetical protein
VGEVQIMTGLVMHLSKYDEDHGDFNEDDTVTQAEILHTYMEQAGEVEVIAIILDVQVEYAKFFDL